MRKSVRLLCGLLGLITVICLCSCGKQLRETTDGVTVSGSDTVFEHASVCYRAKKVGDEVGQLKVGKKGSEMTYTVYSIENLPENEWLVTEEGDVLYARGVHLPTVTEMACCAMRVCVSQTSTVTVLRRVEDPAVIQPLIQAVEGESYETLPSASPTFVYELYFESSAYPQLEYRINYVEYASDVVINDRNLGRYFLYSAFDKLFVPVDGTVHQIMGIPDAD